MNVEFKKPGRTYSKDPQLSITQTTIGLNQNTLSSLIEQYEGTPTHVKIGVDRDAGWVVVLPVESADGAYKLPDEPTSSHSFSSDALRNFVIDKVEGLTEEDLNIRLDGFWDPHEGAMIFEYDPADFNGTG